MMASADAGKRLVPASTNIDKRSSGYKSRQDAVLHKPQAAIKMIHEALLAGIQASYVLMDTWFTNEPFIREVVKKALMSLVCLRTISSVIFIKGNSIILSSCPCL